MMKLPVQCECHTHTVPGVFFCKNCAVLSMAFVLLSQTYLLSFGTPTDFAGWKIQKSPAIR